MHTELSRIILANQKTLETSLVVFHPHLLIYFDPSFGHCLMFLTLSDYQSGKNFKFRNFISMVIWKALLYFIAFYCIVLCCVVLCF